MSFPNIVHGSEEEIVNTYTAERYPLGTKMIVEDGRVFRFAENGAIALVVSKMNQSEAPSANFLDEAVATLAAGVTVLTGVGSTTGNGAASLFKNGYVYSCTATNLNPIMRIKDNTLITAAATSGTITLYNPTVAAFAAADTISYFKNSWKDIIVAPATLTAFVCGVTVNAVAADAYGWVQTGGVSRCLVDGSVAIGEELAPSNGTAGALEALVHATTFDTTVGICLFVQATTEYGPVFLSIE